MTRIRFLASLGAGGVIYLTPMAFNKIGFNATQVGIGIAIAALIGTFTRLLSGFLLDRRVSCSLLVSTACFLTIFADLSLFRANSFNTYLFGQVLIGASAGIYWPAAELAVPFGCGEFPSRRGYALVRSSDALGMSLGALFGTITAAVGYIRLVYLFDTFCMIILLNLLRKSSLLKPYDQNNDSAISVSKLTNNMVKYPFFIELIPILIVSLIATGIFAMLQSALPLDMVRGGLERPPLSEATSGSIITMQLCLLVFLQWPVGRWLADRTIRFGLLLSLLNLGSGCYLLAYSATIKNGVLIIFGAQIFFSIGLAAFLPTATQAVIDITPFNKRGLALALFSQCFAFTALIAPLITGWFLDTNSHAYDLWLLMAALCILLIPILRLVRPLRSAN